MFTLYSRLIRMLSGLQSSSKLSSIYVAVFISKRVCGTMSVK